MGMWGCNSTKIYIGICVELSKNRYNWRNDKKVLVVLVIRVELGEETSKDSQSEFTVTLGIEEKLVIGRLRKSLAS